MTVKIESCWSGGDKFRFRATASDGQRFVIPQLDGTSWNRKYASEMLDVMEQYGYARKNIRFHVV